MYNVRPFTEFAAVRENRRRRTARRSDGDTVGTTTDRGRPGVAQAETTLGLAAMAWYFGQHRG